jgi:hypothetical protein
MCRRPKLRQTTGGSLPARLLRWPQLKPTLHEFRGDSLELLEKDADIHTLSKQMGDSVGMIERHYSKLTATIAANRLA